MGDSAITETAGWGSFLNDLPVNLEGAQRIMNENSKLCLGNSPVYKVRAVRLHCTD